MKIKVGETILPVSNFYPFRYPNGKLVLRFNVNKSDADFNTLYNLLNENEQPIAYYEDDEDTTPQCTYYRYSEFNANYVGNMFEVEQITPSTLDSAVDALRENATVLTETIQNQATELESQNQSIAEQLELIKQQKQELNNQAEVIENQRQLIAQQNEIISGHDSTLSMLSDCILEVTNLMLAGDNTEEVTE